MNIAVQNLPRRKIWETPGGVHPPDNKSQSLQLPLETLASPPLVILPLNQHIGAPATPLVEVGDSVLKGQLVAAAKGLISANIHAPIAGKVSAIESRPIAHPSGMEDLCIIISNDHSGRWCELKPKADYQQLHPAEIIDRIQAAGVVGMGGAGFPTAVKLQANNRIDTLIINATECEPYITADDSLLQNFSDEVVDAIELLDFLLDQPAEILIAIEDNKPDAIKVMQDAVEKRGLTRTDVAVLPTKYPSGGEKQLIQMLTGKEVTPGQIPSHLGIVCQNVATVVAAYRAVVKGEPLISRITTLSGEALERPQNLIVPLGTPIEFVLQQQGLQTDKLSRLVMGGPMMGFTLTDTQVPVVKTTNCILALSLQESPPPLPAQACIRCGMCAEACPASLLPQQLYWYARAQDHEKLLAHNLNDCIECGACSYSCPSHIPLVQYYRAAKAEIRHAEIEKQQSDRARQRFEFHKQRVDAEKEARAEAKRVAAEKAKQRSLEKAKKAAPTQDTPATHEAKPTATKSAPEGKSVSAVDERAKIERNIQSTQDRLQKFKAKLLEAEQQGPEKVQAVQAQIKNTELKLENLQQKLAAVQSAETSDTSEKPADTQESRQDASPSEQAPSQINSDKGQEASENKVTSQQQVDEWRSKLSDTQKKFSQLGDSDTDVKAALQMTIQILESKIASSQVDSSLQEHTQSVSESDDSDPILKAMENALAQKFQQDADASSQQKTQPTTSPNQDD